MKLNRLAPALQLSRSLLKKSERQAERQPRWSYRQPIDDDLRRRGALRVAVGAQTDDVDAVFEGSGNELLLRLAVYRQAGRGKAGITIADAGRGKAGITIADDSHQ